MKRLSKSERRSDCPLSIALEIFGDRWTLLILRDLMFKGLKTFKEFLGSGEQIASNILTDRLQRLQEQGIVSGTRSPADARVVTYRPTEKGLDLLPVLIEIVLWSARHEKTAARRVCFRGVDHLFELSHVSLLFLRFNVWLSPVTKGSRIFVATSCSSSLVGFLMDASQTGAESHRSRMGRG